jgi:uncharacterized protein YcnI
MLMSRKLAAPVRVALLAGAATLVAVFGFAAAAAAHVVVTPGEAPAGGAVRLSFEVPTESDTLTTTKVQVFLDTTHPIAEVLTEPIPGWTAEATTAKLATPIKNDDGDTVTEAVSEITWTAASPGAAIKPEQFLEFPVSMATIPDDVDQLTFKVLQTYSDGSVVRWIDATPAGGPEPEHPAPVLKIQKDAAASAAPTTASTAGAVTTVADNKSSSGTAGLVFGVIGALLGLAGLILGALAYARTRPRPDGAAS